MGPRDSMTSKALPYDAMCCGDEEMSQGIQHLLQLGVLDEAQLEDGQGLQRAND